MHIPKFAQHLMHIPKFAEHWMHIPKSAEHQMHIFAWVKTIFSDFFARCSSLSLSSFPCIHSHLREAKCLCANNYSTTWNLLSKSNYPRSCMRHSCMLLEMNLCMYFKLAFCPIYEASYSHCLVHVHVGKKQPQLKNPMLPVSRVSFSKYLKSLK